jgi:AbrB family looped-hinge helix DNA binding protein
MGASAKVTSKGQITLPAALRDEFNITPGDRIVFFPDLDDRPTFAVEHMSSEPLRPIIEWSGTPKTDAEINQGIGDAVVEDFFRADRASRRPREDGD